MPLGKLTISGSVAGLSLQATRERTGAGQIGHERLIAAAIAGILTTRTADDEGVFTISGHSFLVDDIVDVYWDGGIRYGMKVTAVNGDDVTVGGVTGPGAGDVLPAASTAVTVNTQHVVDTDFDGDKLEMIVLVSPVRGHFDFQDSGGASLEARELTANDPWTWATNIGVTNPLAGNAVDALMLSIGDTTAAKTVKVALIYNSDQ